MQRIGLGVFTINLINKNICNFKKIYYLFLMVKLNKRVAGIVPDSYESIG